MEFAYRVGSVKKYQKKKRVTFLFYVLNQMYISDFFNWNVITERVTPPPP